MSKTKVQEPESIRPFRFGILGTGEIARVFADELEGSALAVVAAVGSRTPAGAEAFARAVAPGERIRTHGSYEALLDDGSLDAVYVALPHSEHAEWAIRAVRAGLHVLCEKPLTVTAPEAMVLLEEASSAGVLVAEALMYRLHPQTHALLDLVSEGAIGEVVTIRASFTFAARGLAANHRLLDPALGGGAILDVGVYPASLARIVAAAALGHRVEPLELAATARRHPVTAVDTHAAAVLRFPGEITAELACGIELGLRDETAVYGADGVLRVESPAWRTEQARGGPAELVLERQGEPAQRMLFGSSPSCYRLEAEALARAVQFRPRVAEVPELPLSDTLGTLALLDRWGREAGTRTGREPLAPSLSRLPRRRTALTRPATSARWGSNQPAIERLHVPGLQRPLSRLILGCDHQISDAHLAVVLESFVTHGGSTVDTAFNYDASMCAGDDCERRLGRCLDTAGLRDEVTLLTKGAHTPDCFPGVVRPQLLQSIERLRTPTVDAYLLHRDNPAVPVGEFVDALHEVVEEGLARVVGMSNWSLERFAAARADAEARHRHPPVLISNQFSLAEWSEPLWPGSHSASQPAWREWLEHEQDVVLAGWSSLARGYLLNERDADGPAAARVWGTEANRGRRARLQALARERGVPAAAVGVAYVLAQPFGTLALIGPRSLAELTTTLQAMELSLSTREVAWLRDGEEST